MDIDKNLSEQVTIATRRLAGTSVVGDDERLAELFIAMDYHFRNGGPLPRAWLLKGKKGQ